MRLLQRLVHFRREKADAVAAGSLAAVKREIRAFEQALGCGAINRRQRHADGIARTDFLFLEIHRRTQDRARCAGRRLPPAPCWRRRSARRRIRRRRAAPPCPRCRDHSAQSLTDSAEQEIAAVVAERVVHLLEVIDIDEMQRRSCHRSTAAPRTSRPAVRSGARDWRARSARHGGRGTGCAGRPAAFRVVRRYQAIAGKPKESAVKPQSATAANRKVR